MAAAGVPVSAIEALGRRAGECNRMLEEGTGAGADFLGWVSLPSSVTETEPAPGEGCGGKSCVPWRMWLSW